MSKIIITDSSLRDDNHAVKHTINLDQIKRYCQFADQAGIPIVEVGQLGYSQMQGASTSDLSQISVQLGQLCSLVSGRPINQISLRIGIRL